MTGLDEREFRAEVAGGAIVGWRSADAGPAALLLHGGPSLSDYLDSLVTELGGVVTTARYQQRRPGALALAGGTGIRARAGRRAGAAGRDVVRQVALNGR